MTGFFAAVREGFTNRLAERARGARRGVPPRRPQSQPGRPLKYAVVFLFGVAAGVAADRISSPSALSEMVPVAPCGPGWFDVCLLYTPKPR